MMKRGIPKKVKHTENPPEPELLRQLLTCIKQNKFEATLEVLDQCNATELNIL